MMDWTDRHCRVFHRSLTRRARLYTEMVTANAVLHGDRERLIGFSPVEHPVALQLGGSDPVTLAQAARIGEAFGYDEINLNVGCPSDRVQSGCFGAALMRQPQLVADCVAAMGAAARVPVTVKCRIGVDDQDPEESLFTLVNLCRTAGVETVIVHARMAWLQGLSPKENRDIPPLDYTLVHRLKAERPDLRIIINGGLESFSDVKAHLGHLDGAMLGRAAYHRPAMLGAVDREIYGEPVPDTSPWQAVRTYRPYMAARLKQGVRFSAMARHMLGLFTGSAGARSWRRILTVDGSRPGAGLEVLDRALQAVAGVPADLADA